MLLPFLHAPDTTPATDSPRTAPPDPMDAASTGAPTGDLASVAVPGAAPPADVLEEGERQGRTPGVRQRLADWLDRRELVLWWLHSAWALAFGVAAMWAGSRNFAFLRLAFAQVLFIWLTSLVLPRVARARRFSPRHQRWIRLGVNYLNKNFYQQVLFFVLPVYWVSVTLGSRNVFFVAVVAVSALLSTVDVVYDRHLSVKRSLTAVFFAFNLFACVNVALPVLWGVANAVALRLAALGAFVGFTTLRVDPRDLRRAPVLAALAATAVMLGATVEWGRSLVPPAPLRITRATFGGGVDRNSRRLTDVRTALEPRRAATLYVMTPILAPLGLRDRVRHRWSMDGTPLRTTPYFAIAGGREAGFRLWTAARIPAPRAGATIQVDVETEGGQLIGRARLPVRALAPSTSELRHRCPGSSSPSSTPARATAGGRSR